MFGHGRGYHRGYWWRREPFTTTGYTYIGPCRCGFGPHTFYQDESGGIVHALQVYRRWFTPTPTMENLKVEIDWLKKEKA